MRFLKKRLFLLVLFFLLAASMTARLSFLAKAADCDLTGEWRIDIHITVSIISIDEQYLAEMTQEPDGTISGTVTDPDGENPPIEITAQIVGNQFESEPMHVESDDYEADITWEGTINDDCDSITGTISGQVTSPMSLPLSGTFEATRLSGVTPTAASTPSPTLAPTSSPTPFLSPTPSPSFFQCFNDPSPIDAGDVRAWAGEYLEAGGSDNNADGVVNAFEAAYLFLYWQEPCE